MKVIRIRQIGIAFIEEKREIPKTGVFFLVADETFEFTSEFRSQMVI